MGTTQRIAVTGTDGTGKTTVVRLIRDAFADRPHVLQAFRVPQYHEGPDLPFGRLSAIIDAVSEFADRRGDLQLKASALFLSMTLYGDVERHLVSTYRPQWVVNERQCLADSLTYARFYVPLLKSSLDREALEPALRQALHPLGDDALDRLIAWLSVFQAREGHPPSSFWDLPLYTRDLFLTPAADLLGRLQTLYAAELPDHIVLLHVSPERLADRLAEKLKGAAPKELHEQSHVLAMFQAGLTESCKMLQQVKPGLQVHVLDTSEQTPEQSRDAVLRLFDIPH
jgi:broad-specificity NMP kinase